MNQRFTREQNLGIYMQVYNLGVDPQTHRASAEVQYQILKEGKAILDQTEEVGKVQSSQQLTLQKTMRLGTLQPGKYTVQIKVKDNVRKQPISAESTFEVR